MHQEQPMTNFLFRYESTSGLWVETKLDSPVSRPLLEAMNAILSKDGILAFIGTRSEFGQYKTGLEDRREADSTGYWTSLPEHTILATLGLCLNPSTAEGRSLVFRGSPRTLMLSVMIDYYQYGMDDMLIPFLDNTITNHRTYFISNDMLSKSGAISDGVVISENELQDSMADYCAYLSSKKS